MKRFKILGLLAVAATATMAFAASAPADYVSTTTGGAAATPAIHAVSENGHLTLTNPIATISCDSTAEGQVTLHGAGAVVGVPFHHLLFTGCTNSWHVTPEYRGELEVKWTSGHDGTVIWNGARIQTTRVGLICVYEALGIHIGTLTGGSPATLHIETSLPINQEMSSPLCGSSASWKGSYVTTSALYVGNS
jgi:uncharacterized oligopeptide transporter (OPT) family protein